MARFGHPVHAFLAGLVPLPEGARVLDLGCGPGATLAAVAAVAPGARLHGVDLSADAIAEARQRLGALGRELDLAPANLCEPLPMAPATFDLVICHNVLECIPDPGALLREAARVTRPGGRTIWSHADFDAIVTSGADAALDRRVIHAYCDATPTWTSHADGRMGRKLAALVRASPLLLEEVRASTDVATEWTSDAGLLVTDIVNTVSAAIARGGCAVTAAELEAWHSQLRAAARDGTFFFAETAFAAVARRS